MASNDTFISYRREVSWTLVEALYQRLTDAGIDVFYDIEDLRAGEFEHVILNQIRARPYFVLVLTPGTLERTADEDDWLRREIETAVESDRVIVPVYTPTFDLSTLAPALPGGLGRKIAGYQAVELPHKYFKYAVAELAEQYLVPIERDVRPTPTEDRPDVARLQRAAAEKPAVSEQQLTAQEYFERAYNRDRDGDVDGAIADYDEAIRLDPEYAYAFHNRGLARYRKGDVDGAIADYDEAIRLDPEYLRAFNNRGLARKRGGDLDGAIADYDEAIRIDPGYLRAFNNRGLARMGRGDVDGAIEDYDEAIRLDPEYAYAFHNRGLAQSRRGDVDGAIADYDEAIRLDPELADAFNDRGVAFQRQGELDRAIADYDEAIRLDPSHALALRNRAQVLKRRRGSAGGAG